MECNEILANFQFIPDPLFPRALSLYSVTPEAEAWRPEGTTGTDYIIRKVMVFILFYFEQYLLRGGQFNEAGLNGALVKRKTNTKDSNTNR